MIWIFKNCSCGSLMVMGSVIEPLLAMEATPLILQKNCPSYLVALNFHQNCQVSVRVRELAFPLKYYFSTKIQAEKIATL